MAYPGTHMLTSFGGDQFDGVEQWSCSLRSTPNFGDGNQFDQGALDEIAAALGAWFGSSASIGGLAYLNWVKHNRIGADGKYVSDVSYTHEYPTRIGGGGPAGALPPQVAQAVTLETGTTRGLACRGRIFLPQPRVNLGSDGRQSIASCTAVATNVANLLTTLNGLSLFGTVSVYSNVREGAVRAVTGVTVGRTIDTIRSRRAQLSEERPPAVAVGGT